MKAYPRPCRADVSATAFSLIELMVVIAIIAVLAAVLMPALSQAKQKARQVQCASNLKQISMMFALYTDEHDGYLPPANRRRDYDYRAPNYYHYGYSQALSPYMGRPAWATVYSSSPWIYQFTRADKRFYRDSVFVCPTYRTQKTLDNNLIPGNSGYAENKYVNVNWGKDQISPWPNRITTWAMPRKIAGSAISPTTRIHMADSCRETLGNRTDIIWETNKFPNFAIRRHSNGANMLFLDSHVRWENATAIKQHLTNSFDMPE